MIASSGFGTVNGWLWNKTVHLLGPLGRDDRNSDLVVPSCMRGVIGVDGVRRRTGAIGQDRNEP